jgi:hypothetical protein
VAEDQIVYLTHTHSRTGSVCFRNTDFTDRAIRRGIRFKLLDSSQKSVG